MKALVSLENGNGSLPFEDLEAGKKARGVILFD